MRTLFFVANYLVITAVFVQSADSFAQTASARKLDSLQSVLLSIDRKEVAKIVKLGQYIANHSESHKQQFEVYSRISEAYFGQNNIDKAIFYLFKAKAAAEDSNQAGLMAQAYGSIANQYSYLNLTEKARHYLNLAKSQMERLPESSYKHRLKALSFLELGNLDFNERAFKKANENYRKSLAELDQIGDKSQLNPYHYRRSLYNIGNSYYYLEIADSAETYLNRALSVRDPNNQSLDYYIKATLGEVYAKKKDYPRAIDTLQAIVRDPAFHNNSLKTEIYLNLSLNYKNLGDDANYSIYNEKYLGLKSAVDSQDLKAINTVFDVEQHDLRSKIQDSDKQFKWLLLLLLGIVVASAASFFYLNRKKRREKQIYQSLIARLQNEVASFSRKPDVDQDAPISDEEEPRYAISAAVEQAILEGLEKFESEQEFRNPDITLPNLATQLKTNPAYVSAVIKANKNNNFNGYINELRIRYICAKLYGHPEYLNYKISYLAEDSGFVSHSAFSTIFKKVTGISPSSFIRQAGKAHSPKQDSIPAS
ncbi:helix-turn-helix domain-containing protein [Flavobacterium selenitireducens]|uniref:helix-turn-helix domain-containing protein n=1 Tax=Flavobacterium selenitireducens TaxID=2722704 RepID=UPI00168BA059|nr:helix-turn-helix domain-containing protein [Flavobacterium selenitireducens]MBD3582261.1 helix-turn-helix domain-containing protein [Flavobacterium selenitireducens]